jgi:hypothetical protein
MRCPLLRLTLRAWSRSFRSAKTSTCRRTSFNIERISSSPSIRAHVSSRFTSVPVAVAIARADLCPSGEGGLEGMLKPVAHSVPVVSGERRAVDDPTPPPADDARRMALPGERARCCWSLISSMRAWSPATVDDNSGISPMGASRSSSCSSSWRNALAWFVTKRCRSLSKPACCTNSFSTQGGAGVESGTASVFIGRRLASGLLRWMG